MIARMRIFVFFLAAFAVASNSFAQDEAEYAKWMKSIAGTMGSMRKHFEAKEAPAAATDAEKVSSIFKDVEAYYAKSNTEDAIKWSHDAQLAANETAEAAKSGDLEKAGMSAKGIGATCGPCHAAHREKLADGSYQIKK